MLNFILRLFESIFGIFRRRRRDEKNERTDDFWNVSRSVILLGPAYDGDELTNHTRSWIEEFERPTQIVHYTLFGKDVTRDAIASILSDTRRAPRIKVFVGHGSANALLAPPCQGVSTIDIGGREHSVAYDAEMVDATPSSLFAFCCYSGEQLGRAFCCHRFRFFLGYVGALPVETYDEQCRDTWKTVIRSVATEIIRDGMIASHHETQLRNLYHSAYLYFLNGDGKGNDRALLMLFYVDQHLESLRRYGG